METILSLKSFASKDKLRLTFPSIKLNTWPWFRNCQGLDILALLDYPSHQSNVLVNSEGEMNCSFFLRICNIMEKLKKKCTHLYTGAKCYEF